MLSPAAKIKDCLIVGAGPAGLSAALYLARFRRTVEIIDAGQSRALWIPSSRNIGFFSEGISGVEILQRGRIAVENYGIRPSHGMVTGLKTAPWGFRAEVKGEIAEESSFRFVLLATGAEDTPPDMPDVAQAVREGLLRYCPVCDGFEASDRRVAVLGSGAGGSKEAEFLIKSGFRQVTLLSFRTELSLSRKERRVLASAGVRIVEEPVLQIAMRGGQILAHTAVSMLSFETVYAALGLNARCGLGWGLGAKCDASGALLVDRHHETSVPGLFAAGDVVAGLSQVVVAMGHAAIAATEIHGRLGVPPTT